jgi:hypothetical protein
MKNDDVLQALQKRHRRSLWLPVLLVACAGAICAALALVLLTTPGNLWKPEPFKLQAWLGVLVVSFLGVALAFWLRRRSLARTASDWDREIHGKNRLEAAAQLAGDETPLAQAQREESGKYLATAGGLRRTWVVPALAAMVALICLAQLLLVSVWVVQVALNGWPKTSPVEEKDKPPRAQFVWVKPKSEIKASPLEEVPLTAQATSSSGLEKVSLEISINGSEKKLSVPIEEKSLTEPGDSRLDLSVFLDELEAEPFDIVSYHLRGQRVSKVSLPAVASDMQFIQVRPLRDEAMEKPGGDGEGDPCLKLLLKLKIAQLGLLKGNHVLGTAELDRSNVAWKTENEHVGTEQVALAGKTSEAVDFFIANDAPMQAVDWLKQAVPEMDSAGRSINETKNPVAIPHQEKALSLITACEKLFVKAIARKGGPPKKKDNLKDPFASEQKYQLTKREETPAGELEQLARKQAELNEEMASSAQSPGASQDAKKAEQQAAREKEIAEKLAGLSGELPGEVGEALKAAQSKAGEAAGHLENGDPQAGSEAGTEALARMQQAIAQMRATGEAAAAEKLASAQKDLNQAAAQAGEAEKGNAPGDKAGEAAATLAETRESLKAEAERQQREGSAEAARRLEDLVNQINSENVGKKLKALAEGGKPEAGKAAGDEKDKQAGDGKLAGKESDKQAGSEPGKQPGDESGKQAGNDPGKEPGKEPGKDSASGKLAELAKEAGKGSLANLAADDARKKTAEELARTAKMMKRLEQTSAANGPGGETATEVVEHFKAQMQNAESVLQLPEQRDAARRIIRNIPDQTAQVTPVSVVVFYETQRVAIEELIGQLQSAPAKDARENTFTVVSEAEVPEAYREPVSRYFEELSRQTSRTKDSAP